MARVSRATHARPHARFSASSRPNPKDFTYRPRSVAAWAANVPSTMALRLTVTLVIFALLTVATLVVTAPLKVTAPLGVALLTGLVAAGVLARLERRKDRRARAVQASTTQAAA